MDASYDKQGQIRDSVNHESIMVKEAFSTSSDIVII